MNDYRIPYEEQESWIHVDYHNKQVNVYSTRPSCIRKLNKVFGNNSKNEWNFAFDDRNKIRKTMNLAILLPRPKNTKRR